MNVMMGSSLLLNSAGYQISRSVRLRSSASAYFNRTPASAGNRKTWTWSGWVKLGSLSTTLNLMYAYSADSDSGLCQLSFQSNQLRIQGFSASFLMVSTPVYRDPSAWYHIVYKVDTTQATAANRVRVYVNGVEITAWATNTPPPQNTDTAVNNNVAHNIGRNTRNSNDYLDGYLTEINLIDGQALDPSYFGETNPVTGVWQPKKYAGTYGTNGFYLNFSDNSAATAAAIGKDYSGNGNNWTPNNISVTAGATYDSMLDVPTLWADGGNGRGNYATLNPLLYMGSGSTKSNGNLRFVGGGTGGPPFNYSIHSTFVINTGKWYWEATVTTAGSQPFVGMFNTAVNFNGGSLQGSAGPVLYGYDGNYYNETTGVSFGNTYTTGDVIGIAVDFDNNLIWFSKNGTWQNSGNPLSGTNGKTFGSGKTWAAGYVESGSSASASTFDLTFGQRPFAYTPPTGFKALNTLNLPTPTILKGNQYMNVLTWSGTGGSAGATRSLTGLGFQPDLVWEKDRASAQDHHLFDSVRGAGTSKTLASNSTGAEGGFNDTLYGYLSSFDADGFTTTNGSSTWDNWNKSGDTYVGWAWKEGATQGFDIVTYTGTGATLNVSHNLGVVPSMIITKSRSATGGWPVYHVSIGATGAVQLESTGATNTTSAYWNNTAPTSTQFTLASGLSANGTTYVAYLFAAVSGFSAFGSYTGNGSADGPFVFLGFRPRWILTKAASGATGSWWLYDTARSTYNEMTDLLRPDLSNADTTQGFCDATANGFKIRNSGNNTNGATYIFAAFAENPFKYSLAR